MKTVDSHIHLLNPNVKFDRFFDRLAIKFFGKKFGLDLQEIKTNPYQAYKNSLIKNLQNSNYISKAILLPVDSKFDKNGVEIHRDKTVCSHSQDVLDIYKEYPDLIIPFMSVNPNRKDAVSLIEKYYKEGAVGMKFLQNYWEVDLGDKKLIPYYEKLVELNLPLIIHIGSEFSIESNPYYESVEMLRLPLESGVKVIAAHIGAGHLGNWKYLWKNFSTNPKNFNRDYLEIIELMSKYDNLYADISALLTIFKARVLRDLTTRGVEDRLLFGTDYPVVFSTVFTSYDLSFKKRWELSKIKNPLDRYCKTILEYFPESSAIYTNYKKLI